MARISGVDLPREKRIEIGLTYIYGIGRAVADEILAATGINPDTRVKDLTESDVSKLREYIDHNLKVEGDLRREVSLNIKRLMEIGCYRGVIAAVCLFVVRTRSRTRVPARARRSRLPARRRTLSNSFFSVPGESFYAAGAA